MRTQREVRRRIKDLRFRYLQKRYKKLLSKRPENCKHNFRQPLRDTIETMGLCIKGGLNNECEWQGTFCDAPQDAEKCPYFEYKCTKKQIAQEFDKTVEDPERCKEDCKDIFVLQWALNGSENSSFFSRFFRLFRTNQKKEFVEEKTSESEEIPEENDKLP